MTLTVSLFFSLMRMVFSFNIIMMRIIEINEENEILEERYKYEMKRNINITIGIVKTYFVKSIILVGKEEKQIKNVIQKYILGSSVK